MLTRARADWVPPGPTPTISQSRAMYFPISVVGVRPAFRAAGLGGLWLKGVVVSILELMRGGRMVLGLDFLRGGWTGSACDCLRFRVVVVVVVGLSVVTMVGFSFFQLLERFLVSIAACLGGVC